MSAMSLSKYRVEEGQKAQLVDRTMRYTQLTYETLHCAAAEIEEKVAEAKVTEVQINEARESYRVVARRASLLYFILNELNIINPIYQFSLKVSHE